MAILSAILSLLSRKLGDLLQALFGWSIRGLFGRLPSTKETALSVALILSILWPVLVVGCFLPKIAAWLVAFLPLHEWLHKSFLRGMWIVLAAISPIIVGLITAWVAPTRKQQGGTLRTVLSGYPLTIGMFLSFLLTFFIVPLLKLIAMARGWADEHVYVQVKEGAYSEVMKRLAFACEKAKVKVHESPVPGVMRAPVRVLKWFARSGLDPVVASDPRMLRGDGIEVYLYPTDVLIRGKMIHARRIRAAIVRDLTQVPAYLTQDEKAQKLEEQLNRSWHTLERHRDPELIRDAMRERLREIVKEIDEADIPYDDWVLLYMNLQRLDRKASGATLLDDAKRPVNESAAIKIIDRRPDASTGALMRETLDEVRALMQTEIALAHSEAQSQISQARRAATTMGAAVVAGLLGLSTLLVALILAVEAHALAALISGASLLVIAGAAAGGGYVVLTRHRESVKSLQAWGSGDA